MKIKIMTSAAIAYIKQNIGSLLHYYENGDDPEKWLKEKFNKECFVAVDILEFEDFTLVVSPDKPSSEDSLNSKVLYSKMMSLNDSFATDERLWAGLSHTIFYDYMLKRWPKYYDKESILNHFFFNQSKPRCYLVNTISRLWWLGRKLYNENFDNCWAMLDYISHDINGYAFTLFGSNWSNSKRTLELFMKAIFKYENETNNKVYRELFNDSLKFTNCFGGIYIIDACSDTFVVDTIYQYLVTRQQERVRESEYNKLNNVKTSGIEKFDNIVKALNRIGGIGSLNDLYDSYAFIVGKGLSSAQMSYIKDSLNENYIDSSFFKGKPIFYKVTLNHKKYWKISDEYLIKENFQRRNDFSNKLIEGLNPDEKLIFNVINTITNEKISINNIIMFKQQIMIVRPDIIRFDVFVVEKINSLYRKGLLEKIGKDLYKKSFRIKIK